MRSILTGRIQFAWAAIALFLGLQSPLLAQKPPAKFGSIDKADLEMTTYPEDPDADAVYLFRFEYVTYLSLGEKIVTTSEHHVRIKILNARAVDNLATLAIFLSLNGTSKEQVTSWKAATYNLESSEVVETKASKDAVFEEAVSKNMQLFRINFPAVREGSVIDIVYTVNSDFFFSLDTWMFQTEYPVRYSELQLLIPEILEWKHYVRGLAFPMNKAEVVSVTATSLGYPSVYGNWIMEKVPAAKPEPYVYNHDNYKSRLEFDISRVNIPGRVVEELSASWEVISKNLTEDVDFGGYLNNKKFMELEMKALLSAYPDPRERMDQVFFLVQKHMKWNENERVFTVNPIEKVWERKEGNSSEINLLLINLLNKAGINTYTVVTSTTDNGFLTRPDLNTANYVFAYAMIGDKPVYLDATDKYIQPGLLPMRSLNVSGMLYLGQDQGSLITIVPPAKNKENALAILNLSPDGTLEGNIQTQYTGYGAYHTRSQFEDQTLEELKKELADKLQADITSIEYQNLDSLNAPQVIEKMQVSFNFDEIASAGDHIYFTPMLQFRIEENPFKDETRMFPIEFPYGTEKKLVMTINLPEGYEMEEAPKPTIVSLPDNAGKFMYKVESFGKVIQLYTTLTLNSTYFESENYPLLKEFFELVITKEAEPIVLKKI